MKSKFILFAAALTLTASAAFCQTKKYSTSNPYKTNFDSYNAPTLESDVKNDKGSAKGQSATPTTNAPFDGGLTLVLAAGLGLGLKKARDRRKMNAKQSL